MGLGLATGAIAFLGGAKTLALWSFGLAAGAAGFVVVAIVLARGIVAGASFTLSTGVIGATLAAMVTLQRGLHWYEAPLLGLVPLAVRLPVPQRSAVAQAIVALVYALAVGGGACALVWMRSAHQDKDPDDAGVEDRQADRGARDVLRPADERVILQRHAVERGLERRVEQLHDQDEEQAAD